MIALFSIFFSSLLIAFSGAMMPGPLLTVTISESSRRGSIAGPLLISGHAMLELLLVIALLLGLGPILKNEIFFLIVALVGGLIMFWMAYGMFRTLPTLSVNSNAKTEKKNNLLIAGAIMSLANPYWIIWWATIGLGYIIQSQKFGLLGIVLFFIGHITGDLIWYWAISFSVARGKKLFTDKVYRILIGVCGTFLVGFALYLVVRALIQIV